ncbi:hypothetical protein HHL19_35350 [Streptomyces sp. R302]|uniref:hypothetical protein n=1 Tax=unclassified Streptomyces TaxID=2593676 RepID=UPI00145C8657|nr:MULTISPECIES: hypothetical protein [unclassified Streptomyces]NML55182.1 hypothetical protein [Streptomyces sp. R301]NML83788.1 hypothetical protein [Streptomyces sp. R302]
MSTITYAIDAVAARRETQYPHGIAVRYTEDLDLYFPAQLPADTLDPLLSDELDLFGLIGEIFSATGGEAGINDIVTAVFRRPRLPRLFLEAVREAFAKLLGKAQYADFIATRPGLEDYIFLTTMLTKIYGVQVGKLLGLGGSSENGGPTSSPTSPATTSSTPDDSGSGPTTPTSSGSGV